MHQEAAFDFVPLLFIAYVVYAIISSLVKAAKQATQANPPATSTTMSSATAVGTGNAAPQMTAVQVRAALTRRMTAASARAAAAVATAAPVAARSAPSIVITSQGFVPIVDEGVAGALQPLLSPSDAVASLTPTDFATLFATLPPAAQAVVASAVIGPCAAHRGSGHNPEDW